MAAAFGIAAGVVGVVSLGTQLVDTAKKLKELQRTYSEAHENVKALIAELELLGRLITCVGELPPAEVLEASEAWCRNVIATITQVLREVDLQIASRPRRGRLQYLFKNDVINDWLQTLERAKSLLLLALEVAHGTQIQTGITRFDRFVQSHGQDHSSIFRALDELNNSVRHINDSSMLARTSSRHIVSQTRSSFECFLFRYTFDHSVHSNEQASHPHVRLAARASREVTWLRIYLPSWFLNRLRVISVRQATSGWRWNLRIHNVLGDEANIFELCMSGDLQAVKHELVSGHASLHDENKHGLTLLHVYAFAYHLEICRFLLEQHVDSASISHAKERSVDMMMYMLPSKVPSISTSLQLFNLLRAQQETEDQFNFDTEVAECFLRYPALSDLDRLRFIVKLYQPSQGVLVSALNAHQELERAAMFRHDLDQLRGQDAPFRLYLDGPGGNASALHLAVQQYLQVVFFPGLEHNFGRWRELCVEAITAGADLHVMPDGSLQWETPLGVAVRRTINSLHWHGAEWAQSQDIIDTCLDRWLSVLTAARVSPSQYAAKEYGILARANIQAARTPMDDSHGASGWAHWIWWLANVESLGALSRRFIYRSAMTGVGKWTGFTLNHDKITKAEDMIGEDHLLPAERGVKPSMPGTWDTSDLSAMKPSENERGNTINTKDKSMFSDHSDVLARFADCHDKQWLSVHHIAGPSKASKAFRRLRQGTKGYANPYTVDVGHGTACRCQQCEYKRKPLVERRAAEGRKLNRGRGVVRKDAGWSRPCRVPQLRDPGPCR